MRFLVVAASFAVLLISVEAANSQRRDPDLVDTATWKVGSVSDDHITYIRRPVETTPTPVDPNADCNKTTTTTPAPVRRSSYSRSRFEVRSGGGRTKSRTTPAPTPMMNYEGGDHTWQVSHKTDDHITYTRRGSSSSSSHGQGQGQPAGELRRLGSGRDSVLARVVVPGGKDQEFTEEAIVEGAQPARGSGGYPTNELVHPYVKKSKVSTTSTSSRSNRTKSLKSGRRHSKSSPSPSTTPSAHEAHPPRIGEVVNGWVVVNKTKDSISWERWGSVSSSTPPPNAAAVANLRARNNENRLRSLKSSRSSSASSSSRTTTTSTRAKALIPNQAGELVEGFPRIFNTYSRSYFVNERNIDDAGSIRTSMSDTRNWNVGDELAGWIVISKDYRGIVWQRKPTAAPPSAASPTTGRYVMNEEDLLEELNRQQEDDEEESSESDSSSESESNENYHGPPGTWYLAKETKNSITWKRDNTPDDVIFEMNAYPRIGDVQTGWKVKSKSRGHITWARINSDGEEIDSNEREEA